MTDYRAYRLGLPITLVDQITALREANTWMSSLKEFQRLTAIPDTTLQRIQPYLQFPQPYFPPQESAKQRVLKDLNTATQSDLEAIRGIGPVLSARILDYRDRIQAFLDTDQLAEIRGLSPSVLQQLKRNFGIVLPVRLTRIPFETASLGVLAAQPYLTYVEARWLVLQRTQQPESPLDSLLTQANWPATKVQRIKLYLY